MQCLFVVDRDLFAGFDVAQGAEENVVVKDLHERVWTARVIDVVRSVPAAALVKTPTIIHLADSQHAAMRTAPRFGVRDFFSGVLGDLVPLFER